MMLIDDDIISQAVGNSSVRYGINRLNGDPESSLLTLCCMYYAVSVITVCRQRRGKRYYYDWQALPNKMINNKLVLPNEAIKVIDPTGQNACVIMVNMSNRLSIYPRSEWVILKLELSKVISSDIDMRRLQRSTIGHACIIDISDGQSITIPDEFRLSFYEFNKEVFVITQTKKIDIWGVSSLKDYLVVDCDDTGYQIELVGVNSSSATSFSNHIFPRSMFLE